MLIQALIKPRHMPDPDQFPVSINNETYWFRRDHKDRFVADVHLKEHADMFLARTDAYRDTTEGDPAKPAVKEPGADDAKKVARARLAAANAARATKAAERREAKLNAKNL
jgi:hypothetical protein